MNTQIRDREQSTNNDHALCAGAKMKRTKQAWEITKGNIHCGADNYDIFLNSINSRKATSEEVGTPNYHRAYYYDTPFFRGYITTDNNIVYGELVRTDRLKGKAKEQYEKLEKDNGKLLTLYDFENALHKEFVQQAISEGKLVPDEVLENYSDLT